MGVTCRSDLSSAATTATRSPTATRSAPSRASCWTAGSASYLDAQPGNWLIFTAGGPLGARRYACTAHRTSLTADLRRALRRPAGPRRGPLPRALAERLQQPRRARARRPARRRLHRRHEPRRWVDTRARSRSSRDARASTCCLKGFRRLAGKSSLEHRGAASPGQHAHRAPPPTVRLRRAQLRETQKREVATTACARSSSSATSRDATKRRDIVIGEPLLQLLEQRLDNVVYRLGLATTRPQARQFVSHGHVLVNGQRVDIASRRVKPGDVVMSQAGARPSVPSRPPRPTRWVASARGSRPTSTRSPARSCACRSATRSTRRSPAADSRAHSRL